MVRGKNACSIFGMFEIPPILTWQKYIPGKEVALADGVSRVNPHMRWN